MSIKKIPDYRVKQKILYIDKANPNVLQNYGDIFLEEGLLSDALDFYDKANYNSGIQKIKDVAFERGDVMLFQQAAKALHLELTPADWESIGRKAADLKKYLFSEHALKRVNKEETINSLKKIKQKEVDSKSA